MKPTQGVANRKPYPAMCSRCRWSLLAATMSTFNTDAMKDLTRFKGWHQDGMVNSIGELQPTATTRDRSNPQVVT